jgi:hypothetical protein
MNLQGSAGARACRLLFLSADRQREDADCKNHD